MVRYEDLTRKEKQLIASEYPYVSDDHLWDTTLGKGKYDTSKFFGSPKEIEDIKEEMAKQDVSLVNRSDFVVGEKTTSKSETVSILDAAIGPFGEEEYRNMLEMSEKEVNPISLIKDLILLQYKRLSIGMQYETDVGMGNNPETEACIRGLESMIMTLHNMINGQKYDVNINSVSSMIAEMDLSEDDIIDLEEDMYHAKD